MNFGDALEKFAGLLNHIGWPSQITWIKKNDALMFPKVALFVFAAEPSTVPEIASIFTQNYGKALAVKFHAVGQRDRETFAYIEPLAELGQGEDMFVADGLKLSAACDVPNVVIVRSRIYWWYIKRRYQAWERDRIAAMSRA